MDRIKAFKVSPEIILIFVYKARWLIPITQASAEVGFEDQKYFRQQFVKLFGMTPSVYVKKYKDSFNKDLNVVK